MNSLGVNPFVNNLYQDLKDGTVLLQVMNKLINYSLLLINNSCLIKSNQVLSNGIK